jgi:hypothetical protein
LHFLASSVASSAHVGRLTTPLKSALATDFSVSMESARGHISGSGIAKDAWLELQLNVIAG